MAFIERRELRVLKLRRENRRTVPALIVKLYMTALRNLDFRLLRSQSGIHYLRGKVLASGCLSGDITCPTIQSQHRMVRCPIVVHLRIRAEWLRSC